MLLKGIRKRSLTVNEYGGVHHRYTYLNSRVDFKILATDKNFI